MASISPVKRKPSLQKDYSKDKFEVYSPYASLNWSFKEDGQTKAFITYKYTKKETDGGTNEYEQNYVSIGVLYSF